MSRSAYIAGPMRSRPQFNYPAFHEAEAQLRASGWRVFNPAKLDEIHDGATPLDLTIEQQYEHASAVENARRYAKRDLSILIDTLRAEEGDAVVVLPGWDESVGARAEVAVAHWVGLPVIPLELLEVE